MTDSAIRTEADLRERIFDLRAEVNAHCIGTAVVELGDLGFGALSMTNFDAISPPSVGQSRWSVSAQRYAVEPDEHTEPAEADNLHPHWCYVQAFGPTLPEAVTALLREARTKAAPK